MAAWLKTRRMRELTTGFWNLLGQNETSAAIDYFERNLLPLQSDVPKPVRAAYHVQRWLVRGEESDFRAVHELAAGTPARSSLARADQVVQQWATQSTLAKALLSRRPPGAPSTATSPADASLLPLEQLALAMTASMARAETAAERTAVAEQVLRCLPSLGDLPAEVHRVQMQLFVWASMVLGRYEAVCRSHSRIKALLGPSADPVLLRAAELWGRAALVQKEFSQAESALVGVSVLGGDKARRALQLQWGLAALEQSPDELLVRWFFQALRQRTAIDSPEWRSAMILGLAVALLQNRRYAEGRDVLAYFFRSTTPGGEPPAASKIQSQSLYLIALSHLAGTQDWADPRPHGSTQGGATHFELSEAARVAFVQNRALWRTLRDQLMPILQRLAKSQGEFAWHAHFLEGLVAFVDPEVVLDVAKLDRFSAALEHVEGDDVRERLKKIQAALMLKVKATEEAVELLRRGDVAVARLRELKQTVLDSLGDAIAPLVRVAVYMALWNADRNYDVLADLRRIAVPPESESLIQRCIQQVQVAQTLRRLTSALQASGATAELLPSLETLEAFDAEVCGQGRLATALVRILQGNFAAAEDCLAQPAAGVPQDLLDYLRFYVAWRLDDLSTCRRFLASGIESNRRLPHAAEAALAIRSRCLEEAVQAGNADAVWLHLLELDGGSLEPQTCGKLLVRRVARSLVNGRPEQARLLVNAVRNGAWNGATAAAPELDALDWTCRVLEALIAARLGQFAVCCETAKRFESEPVPSLAGFGHPSANERMAGWCRLLHLIAEIGQAAQTADDTAVGWRALRREVEERSAALESVEYLRPYVHLIRGLTAYLGTDTLVDDATAERLHSAQQSLSLGGRAVFIERVVTQLRYRRQIVAAYWKHLGIGDLRRARQIFLEEVAPALGERTPASFKLGMVLADWGTFSVPTQELQRRLDEIEEEAPELMNLITSMRRHLRDAETVREIIRLMQAGEFQRVVDLARNTVWAGLEPGAMPVPIAVAQLYAMYKLRQTEEAQQFAARLTQARQFETWISDFGGLLLGYIHFEKQEYPAAAAAFEQISGAMVAGHDVDRYWAAAQFSHGGQLLEVDNKEQAFEAFARSLKKRGTAVDNTNLTPLFVHFGIKSIEARNGSRARHAFQVIRDSLHDLPDSPTLVKDRFLAELGDLLCRALMDEDISDLDGEKFLALGKPLQKASKQLEDGFAAVVDGSLHRLAVLQDLRREERIAPAERRSKKQLYKHLNDRTTALERLSADAEAQDAVLLVLRAALELVFGARSAANDAFENVQKAMRLGVHSDKLTKLVSDYQTKLKDIQDRQKSVLDLFDVYLSNGWVPAEVRREFVRRDDLAELYRLNRNYAPTDILIDDGENDLAAAKQRLNQLLQAVRNDGAANNGELSACAEEMEMLIMQLEDWEKASRGAEKKVLDALAGQLRAQNLELT